MTGPAWENKWIMRLMVPRWSKPKLGKVLKDQESQKEAHKDTGTEAASKPRKMTRPTVKRTGEREPEGVKESPVLYQPSQNLIHEA